MDYSHMANIFLPEAVPAGCFMSVNPPSYDDPFRAPTRDCVQRPHPAIMAALNFYHHRPTILQQVFPSLVPLYRSPGMDFPRYNCKIVTVGEYVYVVGGRHRVQNERGDIEIEVNRFFTRINVVAPSSQWEILPSMCCPRMSMGIAVKGNYIFVAGGINVDQPIRHVEYYSIVHGQWFEAEPLRVERCFGQLVDCQDEIYFLGGSDGRMRALNTVERLDLNQGNIGAWIAEPPMRSERTHFSALGYRIFIFAVGGCEGEVVLNTAEIYNASAKQWTEIQNMILPRFRFSAVIMDDRLHIFGGHSSIIATSRSPTAVHIYTINAGVWQESSEIPDSYLISESNSAVAVFPP